MIYSTGTETTVVLTSVAYWGRHWDVAPFGFGIQILAILNMNTALTKG